MAEWKKIIVSGSDAHLASVTASNLTNDQLVIGGAGGALESSGLTYDGTSLDLTAAAGGVSGSFSGSFEGDGTNLTGLTADFPTNPLGGTSLDAVKFYINDGGDKFLSGSQVDDYVYGGVSGDATIAADGTLTIADTVIEGANLSSSVADGTTIELSGNTLSVLKVPNALTDVDGGGLNDFSFDGSSAVSLEVSGAVDLTDNTITKWDDTSGKFVVSSLTDDGTNITGTTSIQLTGASSNLSGSFSGSFQGDGTGLTGTGGASIISGDAADNQVAVFNSGNTIEGSNDFTWNGSTLAVAGAGTFSTDLTVGGNLVVSGDTINANVTNLDIEDRYILLNSGSATIGDSGIVFGGANGVAQQGAAVIWDASYNSNDGRLAIVNDMASNATGNQTPSYHVAGVYEGTEANAATAQADHVGNIRVEGTDIFIYV